MADGERHNCGTSYLAKRVTTTWSRRYREPPAQNPLARPDGCRTLTSLPSSARLLCLFRSHGNRFGQNGLYFPVRRASTSSTAPSLTPHRVCVCVSCLYGIIIKLSGHRRAHARTQRDMHLKAKDWRSPVQIVSWPPDRAHDQPVSLGVYFNTIKI